METNGENLIPPASDLRASNTRRGENVSELHTFDVFELTDTTCFVLERRFDESKDMIVEQKSYVYNLSWDAFIATNAHSRRSWRVRLGGKTVSLIPARKSASRVGRAPTL